jgi:hypothetical protein
VKAMKEFAVMRGLYWRSLLLLVWMMALAIAVGVLPHHA